MQETEHLERCNFYLILFFIDLLLSISCLNAQVYPDKKIDSLLKSGIEMIVQQKYDKAEELFDELHTKYPNVPLGNIYLAANKIAEAFDYAEPFDKDYILANLEIAKKKSEILLDKNGDDLWNNYFLALSEGYSAYFDVLNDNWLSAFSTGYNSLKSFDECLAINDKFYEAYIALGTYEYWKSRKTEFMHWLPFVDDEKDDAITKLEIAVDSSSYNSYLAINSLIWIYIDQKKFEKAAEISAGALQKFPTSRFFKWALARSVEENNPALAIKYYYEIIESYPPGLKSRINEITLKHIIAQRYFDMLDYKNAQRLCDEILTIKDLTGFEKDALDDRLERVKSLKTEISLKYEK